VADPLFFSSAKAHPHTEVWSFRLIFADNIYKIYFPIYIMKKQKRKKDDKSDWSIPAGLFIGLGVDLITG